MIEFHSGAQAMREINNRAVNIEHLEPEVVIAAFLNARRGDGLSPANLWTPTSVSDSFRAYQRSSLTPVASPWDKNFLASLGLTLSLSVDGTAVHTFFYDDVYGDGLGQIVIDHIRCTSGDERWRTSHLINYAQPASMIHILLVVGVIAAMLAAMLWI